MATVVEAPRPSAPSIQPARQTGKRGSLLLKIGLLAASLVVAAIGAEIGLRLIVPITGVPYYFWDPVVGPRRVPNTAGRYVSGNQVINTQYHFNAQGWNHLTDYTIAKPVGTRRVCIVGDSFVEALQVNPDETHFHVAQQRMSRDDRPVQWYAFGISGWGTTQQYEVIRHYVLDYQPDVVVLLFVENDPFDSSPYLGPIEPFIATYALDTDDKLELLVPEYWQRSVLKRVAIQSAAVRYFMLQKAWIMPPGRSRVEYLGMQRRAGAFESTGHYVPGIDELTDKQRQERTWLLIEKTLAAARDLCHQHGAQFVVSYRGDLPRIEAAARGETYDPPPIEKDPYCLDVRHDEMGHEQLRPIAERLGIPFLDLTEPLIAMVEETGQSHVFPGNSHYNALAHKAAGEAFANWLEPLLQVSEQENGAPQ